MIFDKFLLCLLVTIGLATFLPCSGVGADIFSWLAFFIIALMFFLQGARLSRDAVITGIVNWRLHGFIFICTFVVFPFFGVLLHYLFPSFLSESLWVGVLFLCSLPSTVQSSVAFTSIARGNVAAAICSATASNILGIVITPVLVSMTIHHQGQMSNIIVLSIVTQLFLPFVAGQWFRPWIGQYIVQNRKLLGAVDRVSILIVVYVAFSAAVVRGLWHIVPFSELAKMVLIDVALLGLVIGTTWIGGYWLHFRREDRIAALFCGSKKTLVSGVAMAGIIFSSDIVGIIILPLMIFHQIQLYACSLIAKKYARLLSSDG